MIEIVVDNERNLKNIKQIGSPQDNNKIYVENLAYLQMQGPSYKERRVFVLMGHTERMEGRYATFVEGVIPVEEIEYIAGVPKWNNQVWSGIFREIKRLYEDKIIVGWAMDVKGMAPKISMELERIHREHFGGVHQMLLLMDTLEKEETFYTYKENHLMPKEGFYIYYHSLSSKKMEKESEKERPISDFVLETNRVGRYRELVKTEDKNLLVERSGYGMVVAAALLVFVLGVGVYENKDRIWGSENLPTIESAGTPAESSEVDEIDVTEKEVVQTSGTEGDDLVPVEIISGEVQKNDE